MTAKKILILASNPVNTDQLRLGKEVEEIRQEIDLADATNQYEVISRLAVTPDDLRRALLKHNPQIVHFSGHGAGSEGLVLEDEAGNPRLVSTATLSNLFELFASIECVLLNACYSEVQANAISRHVGCVIGMTHEIGDRAARKFAKGFYSGLGYGRTTEDSFKLGIFSIEADGIPESATPVLKMASQGLIKETPVSEPELEPKPEPVPQPRSTPTVRLENPEGLVPLSSSFYVERPPIEADCYREIVWPSALIRIKAPRQLGKTSLLLRILNYAGGQGYRWLRLSFQRADTSLLNDLEDFMKWFCASVTEALDLPDRLNSYWKGSGGIIGRCQRYFDRYLLPEVGGPLVLGLDEVDQVFEHPETATNFFGMLRDWHEQGKIEPRWGDLRLVIAHSKEVYVPLSINQSPFNVGVPIELRELNQAEVEDLVHRHGLKFSNSDLADLMQFFGGHPYLLRVALHQIALGRRTLAGLLREGPTEGGLYNDHLRRHLNNLYENPELVSALQEALSSDRPVMIGSTEAFKLSSMGLVKYRGNEVIPFCELYREYFSKRLEVI